MKERDLIESNGLTDQEKMQLVIWGDPKMGVRGILGRMDRVERLLVIGIGFNSLALLVLVGHLGLEADPQGGLIGALLRALFGLG
jgi:hypothetical protein